MSVLTVIFRFLKGMFNCRPLRTRHLLNWNDGKVMSYVESLYPLQALDFKMLTVKYVALIALLSS